MERRKLFGCGRYLEAGLFQPKMKPGEKYPLVLFLHGSGERGDDFSLVERFTPGADTFTSDAWQAEHPCFVLAPQCPEDMTWEPFTALLAQSLLSLPNELPIDECRIYATGISMGGGGVWKLLAACPQLLAAAMPICGYGDPFAVRAAKNVPVWAFHAADDDSVPAADFCDFESGFGTRRLVSSLRSAGNRQVRYTEYPAGYMQEKWDMYPHGSWHAAYRDEEALAWLFSHTRRDRYEIELICPGVFYIEDFNNDSMYLVEGRDRALLIDTGLGGGDFLGMVRSLTALPVSLAVTHAHGDHMFHSDQFGKFYMSGKEKPLLADSMRRMMPESRTTAEDILDIADGDVIDLGGVGIEVIEVGGHTPGSVVFVDRKHQCLFTGDALGCWMQVPGALPISVYRENLVRLKVLLERPGYDALGFLGGHRRQEGGMFPPPDPYVPNSYERIDDMIELCTLVLAREAAEKPSPFSFGEPAFSAAYRTASMVFSERVRK